MLEVHEPLTWIHDILDNAVSKWVGNAAHILAYIFNSALRQHCEVLTSHFPFLHNFIRTLFILKRLALWPQ